MLLKNLIVLGTVLLSTAHDSPHFYSPVLTVNGYPLNHDNFALQTRGELKLIKEAPGELPHKSVPFRVVLRREGEAVGQWSARKSGGIYSFHLNELWPLAQVGDELVVESIGNSKQQPATVKQVIKLKPVNLLMNWVINSQVRDKRDGC